MPTRADIIHALNAGPIAGETESVDSDTIRDDKTFNEGDCELISVDNCRFRVSHCYLVAHSKVFRDMYNLGDGTQDFSVTLTDREFETAAVIRLFLCAAVRGDIRSRVYGSCRHLRELVLFADKYDCDPIRRLIHSECEVSILRGYGGSLELFAVAATADDRDLCHLLVQERANETWPRGNNGRLHHRMSARPGMSIWDVRSWPESAWRLGIPVQYQFALARAHGQLAGVPPPPGVTLADEFEKYLKLIKPGWRDYRDPDKPPEINEYYWDWE
ncbi:hypothetical protein CC85DRAFT_305853 [Cutaneotrichosporon oleaginosum]|uniref:BTB domain-containing protein n=1 Tax=Cutaneotrichosporon oleaginosum TaxID=879819 RepID=A0A0J0XBW9_9TREE|nr:uncharacterized protein CC85DRAFT_305853 [Cutaneotrichosporon oleaginosum]KLT38555.1 hypothetical protein CC85DRAFT_305853 [Cutaneotrichosporon oleaginosum]TXT08477.1 hypothetical protein COLE_05401 [Cutaneotrichosporon oleaginosum]